MNGERKKNQFASKNIHTNTTSKKERTYKTKHKPNKPTNIKIGGEK